MKMTIRYLLLASFFVAMLTLNCDCVYCTFCPNCGYCDDEETSITDPDNGDDTDPGDEEKLDFYYDFRRYSETDIANGVVDNFANYVGQNVLLINYTTMDPNCVDCRNQALDMTNLYEQYSADGLVIISLVLENYSGTVPTIDDIFIWMRDNNFPDYYTGIEPSSRIGYIYYSDEILPYNMVVDTDSTITYQSSDYNYLTLQSEIDALLN